MGDTIPISLGGKQLQADVVTGVLAPNPNYFDALPFSFTGPNQQFVFPCAGAGAALIQLTDNFTGSISSLNSADLNPATTSPSRLYMTGVGSLGRSTITGQGVAHAAQYRVVLGGSLYVLRTSADFVGTASGAVFATDNNPLAFSHGAVHTADEEALRAGRAFTTTTGVGTVASGNKMVLYISNPANSGVRIFIPHRVFTATRVDNLTAVGPQFYGISNPTGNIPTGVGVVSNRGDGSVTSPIISRFAVTDANNLPTGGTQAAGNIAAGGQFDLSFERTLEPGKSFAQVMDNTTSGALGGAFSIYMSITAAFYQEPI